EPPLDAGPLIQEAFEHRPDLAEARSEVLALHRTILAAYGRYLPGADAVANVYTHRDGLLERVDWDFSVDLSVPIFEGFATSARLRDAQAQHRQAGLRYEALARGIADEVTAVFHAHRASRAALASRLVEVTSAEENFRQLEAEYRAG